MKRKAKTGHTPGNVLRFKQAARTLHRTASRRDSRQQLTSTDTTAALSAMATWKDQWRKRKELLRYIVSRNPDLRRIELMHRLLHADAAAMVRVVEAIGE